MGIYLRKGHWWYRRRVNGKLFQWSLAKYGVVTEAQAKAYERAMTKARLEDHLAHLDPSRVTLAMFTQQFLTERKPFLAATSLDRYRVTLRAVARDLGEDLSLRGLTSRKLAGWSASRLARGITPAGVNADLRHIRAVLRQAVKWGVLEKAPEVEMVKSPKPLPRHLTPDQVSALLGAETHPDRARLWTFLLWTGCRRSEALGLRWEQIAWDTAPAARVTGKGDKARMVPLLPAVIEAIANTGPLAGPACPWPKQDLGLVFTFPTWHDPEAPWAQVGPNVVSKWFLRLARAAGVPARLHDLRHTAATWMMSRGVPPRMVQEVLGHASFTTTEQYAKALVADLYAELMRGIV